VALEIFSPERYETEALYDEAMEQDRPGVGTGSPRSSTTTSSTCRISSSSGGIRIMEMEWIDGYDLSRLLAPELLDRTRPSVSDDRWKYLNNVIVTAGPRRSRLASRAWRSRSCASASPPSPASIATASCHGDIKTSNIMVKRTGNAKIIDIGSALALDDMPANRHLHAVVRGPEVLEGEGNSPLRSREPRLRADRVLSGQPPFAGLQSYRDLLEAKRSLAHRLPQLLPADVHLQRTAHELLPRHDRRRPCPAPSRGAEDADLLKGGAANSTAS